MRAPLVMAALGAMAALGVIGVTGAVGVPKPPSPVVLAAARLPPTFADDYINQVADSAQQMSGQYGGVPASVAIAQSILESNWGRSKMAVNDQNYFGFKCASANPGPIAVACHDYVTHEYGPPRDVHALFRVYTSRLASFQDYGRLMNTSGYAWALRDKGNPDRFIRDVAPRYSTNPQYAGDVITTMRAHDLYRFDHGPPAALSGTS